MTSRVFQICLLGMTILLGPNLAHPGEKPMEQAGCIFASDEKWKPRFGKITNPKKYKYISARVRCMKPVYEVQWQNSDLKTVGILTWEVLDHPDDPPVPPGKTYESDLSSKVSTPQVVSKICGIPKARHICLSIISTRKPDPPPPLPPCIPFPACEDDEDEDKPEDEESEK